MLHPAHILAYAPVDNYMNQHQNVAMYLALGFIAFLIFMALKKRPGTSK